jgi:hypothetical protein
VLLIPEFRLMACRRSPACSSDSTCCLAA